MVKQCHYPIYQRELSQNSPAQPDNVIDQAIDQPEYSAASDLCARYVLDHDLGLACISRVLQIRRNLAVVCQQGQWRCEHQ